MPRKPSAPPRIGNQLHGGEKGLAVKDGLREVRFNVKHGARKLVRAVEAATQRHDDDLRGPLELLGKPLNLAVRTTAQFLSSVDHAAIDVLSSDGPYRSMKVELPSSSWYLRRPPAAPPSRDFATDHHWRYRHWLEMKQIADVFVHEQAIALAGARLAATDSAADGLADADARPRTCARVIQALMGEAVLGKPTLLAENDEDELAELSELGAVVVVLAGEVAASLTDRAPRERYLRALKLSDEIAVADRSGWKQALDSVTPTDALGRWIAFVLRYL